MRITERIHLTIVNRLFLLLLIALVACSPARREIGRNMDAVRHITFSGNGGALSGHNDLQLEQQLEQQDSKFGLLVWPLMYWVDPEVLSSEQLLRDAYRLEVWYAHHGWFEAKFLGWEVERVRKRGARRAGVVDIRGFVEPGAQSKVSEISITGLDKPRFRTLKEVVHRDRTVREGDFFDLSYAETDRALILDLLFGTGFPYASVELVVDADPFTQEVRITYAANTGIHAKFGPTTIVGLDKVQERHVQSRLTYEPGDEYKIDRLRESRTKLLEMDTFDKVAFEPDLSDPTRKRVPIRVDVRETRWRSLRLGIGTSAEKVSQEISDGSDSILPSDGQLFDGLAWSPRVSAVLTHANVFRELIRLELRTSAGVYYEPNPPEPGETRADNEASACWAKLLGQVQDAEPKPLWDDCPHTLEPTWMLGTTISWPRILGERWGLEYDGQIERDVFLGDFPLRRIGTSLSAVFQPERRLQFRVGPVIEASKYFYETEAQERRLKKAYGDSFEDPYVLIGLDQRVIFDRALLKRRTKVLRGLSYAAIGLRETLPTHTTAQRFLGTDFDTRYRFPIPLGQSGQQLIQAFALRGEYKLPYSDRDVAYPERAFLGGATSIRGFRTGQMGPYDAIVDPEDNSTTFISRGGTLALQGSAELKYPWFYGITWAAFVDAGTLSEGFTNFGAGSFRYSGGLGARYATLVGPIRFDISFRPLFPEDFGPATVYPEGAGPVSPRSYDLITGLFPEANPPPFATVIFLAIGDAL